MAIEIAMPPGANEAAMDTAIVIAVIDDVSVALISIEAATTPVLPTPRMPAVTVADDVSVAEAPAPLRLTPTTPPDSAADPAGVTAQISWSAEAVSLRAPPAETEELFSVASTEAVVEVGSSVHLLVSA